MGRDTLVCVAIPSTETWSAQFGMSLAAMIADFCGSRIGLGGGQQDLQVRNVKGSILPKIRQDLVEAALAIKATHVLFIDSDQTFPPYLLRQLLMDARPVVACNVATKVFPTWPTARAFDPEDPRGKIVYSNKNKRRLEKVWRVGTGIMLIESSLFLRLEKPWFHMKYVPENNTWIGEDWCFCEKLQQIGIQPWVDHELSMKIGHVGPVSFDMDMVIPEVLEAQEDEVKVDSIVLGPDGKPFVSWQGVI